jgi:hypothetical protein
MSRSKQYADKRFAWRGRQWTIRKLTDPDYAQLVLDGNNGQMMSDQALIMYRGELPDDLAIMTILHEAGHELFPEWDIEPSRSAASELGVFERDLKGFLEAAGVDLSPLLVE